MPIQSLKVLYLGEYHRFPAWCNDKGNLEFAKTLDSIACVLGVKDKSSLCLKYRDEEDDLVTVSTTKELSFAFSTLPKERKGCLRLEVTKMETPSDVDVSLLPKPTELSEEKKKKKEIPWHKSFYSR